MAPPQWAYQVENFVTKPDDELVCSVCHAVFCDPIICPCDHAFCRKCITTWLQNNENCPICRKKVSSCSIKQMIPIVRNLINKLSMNCKNKGRGCKERFTLESCEAHMKECQFERVHCRNKPCSEKLFRKDIEKHEKNGCPHRYMKCKKCNVKMSLAVYLSNHGCSNELQLLAKTKCARTLENESMPECPSTSAGCGQKRRKESDRSSKALRSGYTYCIPGTANDLQMTGHVTLHRPISQMIHKMYFRKEHRFGSFGITFETLEMLKDTPSPVRWDVMTTPLMEIPWDRIFMYLTPSEFAILPDGTICTKVKCTVYYRCSTRKFINTRTFRQFAVPSDDIISAYALNYKFDGLNMKITGFDPVKKVIPTGVSEHSDLTDYETMAENLYGSRNDIQVIPKSLVGQPYLLNSYYCLKSDNVRTGEWPCIESEIDSHGTNILPHKVIASVEYRPKISFLKKPLKNVRLPVSDINAAQTFPPSAPKVFQKGQTKYHIHNKQKDGIRNVEQIEENSATFNRDVHHCDLIESSQLVYSQCTHDQVPQAQPWLHVGIRPCPTLQNSSTESRDYLEVAAQFRAVCEMECEYDFAPRTN